MNKGIWYGVGAYATWGLFPVYFKWLQQVPALQVVGHRILWSCVILIGTILLFRQWRTFQAASLKPRTLAVYSAAAVFIAINWLMYVWAVNAGYIVETSLGYFINPLVNVFLGVVFLRERLRTWQWASVALAAIGVLFLTFAHGSLPWIGLTLAFAFGFYGLVKKIAPLNSLHGLTLETALLFLPAIGYLLYANNAGNGAFLHETTLLDLLLVGSGLLTTIPLLMFATAARRLPLSGLGVLQYIAPTTQFLLGVLVYHEPFGTTQLVGFGIVWVALIVFVAEGLHAHRTQTIAVTAER